MVNDNKLRGTVKWYNPQIGYGYIKAEDGREFFAHNSSILMEGFRRLWAKDEVTFLPDEDGKGRIYAREITVTVPAKKNNGEKAGA